MKTGADVQQYLKKHRNPKFAPQRLLPELSEEELDKARKHVKVIFDDKVVTSHENSAKE
jgi:hypothetical protein